MMDREAVVCPARRQLIKERIELAGSLLVKAQQLKHGGAIKGFQRIERKIKAEKNFLESVSSHYQQSRSYSPKYFVIKHNNVEGRVDIDFRNKI